MSNRPGSQQQQYVQTPFSGASIMAKSKTDYVQIDALVVLKLVKHCHEINGGSEIASGILTGMVQEGPPKKIEVTNCFPLPNLSNFKEATDVDYDETYNRYITDNLKNFRHLNIDHLIVGWYQSSLFGSFVNKDFIESQYMYQNDFNESIALIYDPFKTQQGSLHLKAYRLMPNMMELQKKKDFTADAIKELHLLHDNFIEELPLVIKNSHLVNSLLCEIEENAPSDKKFSFLDLATGNFLEKNIKSLIENVDELSAETNKYLNYQKLLQRQNHLKQQHLQKREAENAARVARGELPLPEEDLTKLFKPLTPLSRVETLLISNQIKNYCQQINEFAAQSFSTMFVADALQNK